MPLRIAHVANEAFGLETANGVQHVVYCLAHAQAEIGASVAVFTRDDRAVHVLSGGAEPAPSRVRTVCSGSDQSFRERLLSRYFERTLAEDVLAWHPEFVHFHSVHIPQNVALAEYLGRARIPYCVTVHGGLFHAAMRRGRLKKAAFNLFFELRYLNKARFIHALTLDEAEVIRHHGIVRPIVIVPNGLPPDTDMAPSQPDVLYAEHPWLRDRQVFMFIGRLDSWQKGLDLLVEGFARAALNEAALVLVGPEYRGSRHALATLAGRFGVSSDLVFLEPAFGQDRANLFAAADVFVHPSRWEGVSLSVLAAAAAGKPCLITREADPLGELERAQAAVIVEAKVSSIAEGLKQAASLSRHELQVMGALAQSVAEAHFTWPAIAGKLVDAYRSALEQVPEGRSGQHERAQDIRS